MNTDAVVANPFSLMMEPERILDAMAHSSQLCSLRRHQLHPLDKPLIPYTSEALVGPAAYDAMVDTQAPDPLDDYLLN